MKRLIAVVVGLLLLADSAFGVTPTPELSSEFFIDQYVIPNTPTPTPTATPTRTPQELPRPTGRRPKIYVF